MRTFNCWWFLALVLIATGAQGQTARSGGSAANAQVMQQMQQLASERTQLQAENARMKQELDDLKKRVKGLEGEKETLTRKAQNSEGALSRSTANTETLNQSLTQQRARMEELVAKFRETAINLRDAETERAKLKGDLGARDRELKSCVDKNLALYDITSEVLDHFEKQGFWSSLAKSEPFTRLKRTQMENLVDEYRARADDQRVSPSAQQAETTPPPGS